MVFEQCFFIFSLVFYGICIFGFFSEYVEQILKKIKYVYETRKETKCSILSRSVLYCCHFTNGALEGVVIVAKLCTTSFEIASVIVAYVHRAER